MTPAYSQNLSRFNKWANTRLFETVSGLEDAAYQQDWGGDYGSIHAVLNHGLALDRIWLYRLGGGGEPMDRLDRPLFDDRQALRAARVAHDDTLIRHIGTYEAAHLEGRIQYTSIAGQSFDDPTDFILAHIFNAQSQIRGRALQCLAQTAASLPQIDLIFFLHDRSET